MLLHVEAIDTNHRRATAHWNDLPGHDYRGLKPDYGRPGFFEFRVEVSESEDMRESIAAVIRALQSVPNLHMPQFEAVGGDAI